MRKSKEPWKPFRAKVGNGPRGYKYFPSPAGAREEAKRHESLRIETRRSKSAKWRHYADFENFGTREVYV